MRPAAKWTWAAVGVHVFTALGAVCALFATLALLQGALELMFVWLGAALVIDGLDGPLARRVHVLQRLPRFSGERLDLVIDYLTYVFVPALALWLEGIVAGALGLALVVGILVSSLFHFADQESKATDNSFVGFPALWNLVAFYLFAFDAGAFSGALVIVVGIGLTFVPWRWVHPLRVRTLRPVTLAVVLFGSACGALTLATGFPAAPLAQLAFIAVAVYGIGLTLLRGRA